MMTCTFLFPIALAACLTAAPAATERAPGAERPPNIVLIISDDQAWTDFGFMGHEVIRTPHLDRLADESAVFPRGYVPSSLCRPSLATLVTGLYPHQHKLTGNDPPPGTNRAEMLRHIRRLPTLPRRLAEKGYLSHQSGKWWEGHYSLGGFTHGMTHGDPARGGRHGDEGLTIGRQGMQPIFDFIDECGDRPFFVWYAPFLPHRPHNPPPRLLEKYAADGKSIHVARYQAMCEWFDETCGELLAHLDRRELAGETLVAFVTDNGWIQAEDQPGFAPKSKRSPYDGGLRTPILLRWPGRIKPGRYEALVSSVDIPPSLLAAAGLPADDLPGVNLLDAVAADGRTDREAIFGAVFDHDVVNVDDPAPGLLYRWCIQENWKVILPAAADKPPELYDLAADPHETANLAEERPEVLRRLTEQADEWWDGKSRSGT